jgi:hypothetical protein
VLSVLHHHCYFPTYSNRLKDIAGFLGYQLHTPVQTGIDSIVFRERWEVTRDDALKDALIAYNRQDCEALKKICDFVRKITASASGREGLAVQNAQVLFADSLRTVGEGKRPAFRKAVFLVPAFDVVNKCAYFDYQRNLVSARSRPAPTRKDSKSTDYTKRRISQATLVAQPLESCPSCGSKRLTCDRRFVRWQIDLKYYKTQIGVKKWQPRYLVSKLQCLKCGQRFTSPNVPSFTIGRAVYGHGLMCWCVYHNILGRQSLLSVHRGLKDIFNLSIPSSKPYEFKAILASYYADLSNQILARILNRRVIHIDETP